MPVAEKIIIVSTEEGDNVGDLDDYRKTVHEYNVKGMLDFRREGVWEMCGVF
jgi:hypothetical protein